MSDSDYDGGQEVEGNDRPDVHFNGEQKAEVSRTQTRVNDQGDEEEVAVDGDQQQVAPSTPPETPIPEVEELVLDEKLAGDSLSMLCKIGDGLAHAFVKFECKNRDLTSIDIMKQFVHVRYVDISNNNIHDITCLGELTHLLVLKADHNKLTAVNLPELPYLQVANFSNNSIRTTSGCNHPQLETLNLNNNKIKAVKDLNPSILTVLHTLEMRGNRLSTTKGVALPNLRNLFMAANQIVRIEGLERMGNLATLHLRGNKLDNMDGFSEEMMNLQYLNLRENLIADINQIKKLQCLPKLRAVVFKDCPYSGEDEYRMEVLIALRRIERLDKDDYNDDERQEGEEIYEQRRQEELAALEQGDDFQQEQQSSEDLFPE